MVCTIVLSYLISIYGGEFEPRTKHLDVETANIMVDFMYGEEFTHDGRASVKDITIMKHGPFDCNKDPSDAGVPVSYPVH